MKRRGKGMDKLTKQDGSSPDIVAENVERLRELFPEVFADGAIDFEALKETLGEYVDDREERYSFNWHGKSKARQIAQMPSASTLLPCPDESVNWDSTKNIFIEGDNLEVLKLLQKSYHRKVKMIYIDPPYNTGKEFIYPDKYQDNLDTYLKYTGQVDDEGSKLSANPETSGRYHTNWLNMMYPRLKLARNLLRDDGVIFVSIDYHEFHNLRRMLDEVFGEENFLGTIVWKGATDNNPTQIALEHEYLTVYARDRGQVEREWKNRSPDAKVSLLKEYRRLRETHSDDTDSIQKELRRFIKANSESLVPLTHYNRVDEKGPYTGSRKVHNPKPGGYEYDVVHPTTGEVVVAPANGYRYPESRMANMISEGRILFGSDHNQILQVKQYLEDYRGKLSSVVHLDSRAGANELARLFEGDRKVFTNPKPVAFLKPIFEFVLNPGDILLDFFCGSASSAQAVIELARDCGDSIRHMMVQLPEPTGRKDYETIPEISRARLRALASQGSSDTPKIDSGFRAFSLASSNLKTWDAEFHSIETDLVESIDHIKSDRSEQDVLFELLLKYGLDLAIPIETRSIDGQEVFVIGAGALVVCLAADVALDVVNGIAALKTELKPAVMRVVFKDSGFASDVVKTNATQILKQAGIDDVKSL